ncbi:3462_t:CDS:2 [Acaulospora morrowiae]|uniref:3462_t:CDS:1 n=1 Tax=Acaulospora morrowiae TaxID=94023 RepID=A0A9N9J8L9_9GLOM|nr:3462_t:CDS:2 [Acaulospora morrowiae]
MNHYAQDYQLKKTETKAKVIVIEEQITSPDAKFIHIEENREQLLRFNGKIDRHPTWILLNIDGRKKEVFTEDQELELD